ncbi:MAG: Lrp/AsnC family transcriptional regulator [Candidatus Methanospirareceae archaeon]
MEKEIEEILRILEANGRASEEEIATMVGMKVEEVRETIGELERKGVIRKYKAVINYEKAGVESVQALIDLKISPERDTGYDSIAKRIAKFPEVKSVYLVSGEYDLLVLVCGRTMKEVAYFVAEKIAPLEQVRDTVTHFVLKTYKEDGEIWEGEEEEKRLPVTL